MEKAMAGSSSSKPFEKPCQLTVCGLLAILLQMRSAWDAQNTRRQCFMPHGTVLTQKRFGSAWVSIPEEFLLAKILKTDCWLPSRTRTYLLSYPQFGAFGGWGISSSFTIKKYAFYIGYLWLSTSVFEPMLKVSTLIVLSLTSVFEKPMLT